MKLYKITVKQMWSALGFDDAQDLADHVGAGLTAEKLEALNAGDLEAITLQQAGALANDFCISLDELFTLATKNRKTFTVELREARERTGITQQEAAGLIGDNFGQYRAKETGAIEFTASELIKLGEAFKMRPGALLQVIER